MKIFLTAVAFATLVASPAFAASHKHAVQTASAINGAYSSYAAAPGQDVVVGDEFIGRDPDANVRLQLLRDAEGYAY